jgi:hypothetical protein
MSCPYRFHFTGQLAIGYLAKRHPIFWLENPHFFQRINQPKKGDDQGVILQ